MTRKTSIKNKTYRLIPTKYSPIASFDKVASAEDLSYVMETEGWTNDRLVKQRLARLPKEKWVYGFNNSSIIMAAFLHTPEGGLRFNSGDLGAWYCSTEVKTSIAEVASHAKREAKNSNLGEIRTVYRSYVAKIEGEYIDLRGREKEFKDIYIKDDWSHSQIFGEQMRSKGEDGICYDSVRIKVGTNIVVYDTKKINMVVVGSTYDILIPEQGKIIAIELS